MNFDIRLHLKEKLWHFLNLCEIVVERDVSQEKDPGAPGLAHKTLGENEEIYDLLIYIILGFVFRHKNSLLFSYIYFLYSFLLQCCAGNEPKSIASIWCVANTTVLCTKSQAQNTMSSSSSLLIRSKQWSWLQLLFISKYLSSH